MHLTKNVTITIPATDAIEIAASLSKTLHRAVMNPETNKEEIDMAFLLLSTIIATIDTQKKE